LNGAATSRRFVKYYTVRGASENAEGLVQNINGPWWSRIVTSKFFSLSLPTRRADYVKGCGWNEEENKSDGDKGDEKNRSIVANETFMGSSRRDGRLINRNYRRTQSPEVKLPGRRRPPSTPKPLDHAQRAQKVLTKRIGLYAVGLTRRENDFQTNRPRSVWATEGLQWIRRSFYDSFQSNDRMTLVQMFMMNIFELSKPRVGNRGPYYTHVHVRVVFQYPSKVN
jgi:hypothetical protein